MFPSGSQLLDCSALTTMRDGTQKCRAVKMENQIYPDNQSLACESNVCFAVLCLLRVGKQPAFPAFDGASDTGGE